MMVVKDEILISELKNIIAEITEIAPEKITPKANFVSDLGMDSMMALEILASVEKKYKIKIPEEYLTRISTLDSLLDLTKKIMSGGC